MGKLVLRDVMDYIEACIYNDFMMGILITSASEGRVQSLGFDYGVGKSHLMLHIAHVFVALHGKCKSVEEEWNMVFSMLCSFPWEIEQFFCTAPRRHPGDPVFRLYEDIQETLGKDKSRDPYVRSLKNRATTARPRLAVLFATSPDIGELSLPWRFFFNFEIKVPQRGIYEVQRLRKWTDFRKPYDTQVRMDRRDWKVSKVKFPKLPDWVERRYDKWRDERDRRFDDGEGEWRLRSIRNVLTDSAKELLQALIRKESYTRQQISTNMDKALEMKLLKNCGLVEMFGDIVVPTKQARKLINIL